MSKEVSKENFQSFIKIASSSYENYISQNFDKINLEMEIKNYLIDMCRKISFGKLGEQESNRNIGLIQGVLFQCGERNISDLMEEIRNFIKYSEKSKK